MKPTDPDFPQRLRACLESGPVSVRAAARSLGLSHTMVLAVLSGQRHLAPSQVTRLLGLLGLPADEAAALERAHLEHLRDHGGSPTVKDLAQRALEALPSIPAGDAG